MADKRSGKTIAEYFGVASGEKRKAAPSAEQQSERSDEKKSKPAVPRVRKFQQAWKERFPWVQHNAENDVMFCSVCRKHPNLADKTSSLYVGCGTGNRYRIDSLTHHNASKEHMHCVLATEKEENTQYVEPIKAVINKNLTQLNEQTQSAVRCLFNTAYFTRIPGDRKLRTSYGDAEVASIITHFSSLLSDEEKEGAIIQWQELKIYLLNHRTLKPLDVYSTLLTTRPDNLKYILVLINLMLSLSPTTAKCERSFSAMNRLKTNLKTRMHQATLSDLLRIKGMDCSIQRFDPDPAIQSWLLSAKTRRHVMSVKEPQSSSSSAGKLPAARPAIHEILPPLPELPAQYDDSDSDSDD